MSLLLNMQLFFCFLLFASITCYALLLTGVITDWSILIGLCSGVLITLVALILGLQNSVNEISKQIKVSREQSEWKLIDLLSCQKNLMDEINNIGLRKKFVIQYLGLDFDHAWSAIYESIRKIDFREVEFQLLILTPDMNAIGTQVPAEVRKMCNRAKDTIKDIDRDTKKMINQFKREGRKLSFILKKYNEIPVWHGFKLKCPVEIRYFSYCRWNDIDQYSWGDGNYRRISGSPLDSSLEEMAKTFDHALEHTLKTSTTILEIAS